VSTDTGLIQKPTDFEQPPRRNLLEGNIYSILNNARTVRFKSDQIWHSNILVAGQYVGSSAVPRHQRVHSPTPGGHFSLLIHAYTVSRTATKFGKSCRASQYFCDPYACVSTQSNQIWQEKSSIGGGGFNSWPPHSRSHGPCSTPIWGDNPNYVHTIWLIEPKFGKGGGKFLTW